MKRFFMLALPAAFLAVCYAAPWYWNDAQQAQQAIYPPVKPFIFRVLMPWLAQRILRLIPMRTDLLVILMIAASGVLFALALWKLAESLRLTWVLESRQPELIIIALFGAYLAVFCKYPKLYDLMSAALFTLCLYYLVREQFFHYMICFALASLNRETAFFLLPIFAVYGWRHFHRLRVVRYAILQLILFTALQIIIHLMYQDAPGVSVWVAPIRNIRIHATYLPQTLLTLSVFGGVLWQVGRGWKDKPYLLRLSLIMLLPVFVLLYLTVGQPFEFRVFGEVYPVLALLIWSSKPEIPAHNRNHYFSGGDVLWIPRKQL